MAPDWAAAMAPVADRITAMGDFLRAELAAGRAYLPAGQDVLRAWALGARGVLSGRAMLYGLGAFGEEGVSKALQILHKELDTSMAFCGHTRIETVDRSILVPGTYPVER